MSIAMVGVGAVARAWAARGPLGPRVTVPSLKRRRVERGLTQAQLAELAGIVRQVIIAGEAGHTVGYVSVTKLAQALGCTPQDLMAE